MLFLTSIYPERDWLIVDGYSHGMGYEFLQICYKAVWIVLVENSVTQEGIELWDGGKGGAKQQILHVRKKHMNIDDITLCIITDYKVTLEMIKAGVGGERRITPLRLQGNLNWIFSS